MCDEEENRKHIKKERGQRPSGFMAAEDTDMEAKYLDRFLESGQRVFVDILVLASGRIGRWILYSRTSRQREQKTACW